MKFEGQSFEDTTVILDGNAYFKCKFTRCRIVFTSNGPVYTDQCSFTDCTHEIGGAAAQTFEYLRWLNAIVPNLVEATFDQIRGAKPKGPGGLLH